MRQSASPKSQKIYALKDLALLLATLKAEGKRIVHCHGVFDLLHVGHLRHFEEAKSFGDILVVTITPDKHVNKGSHRPLFNEALRAELIASLFCVDYVAVNDAPLVSQTIRLLKPDFYVKGPDYRDKGKDYTGGIFKEEEAITSVGGKLAFTDDITFSSTHLINRAFSPFAPGTREYLERFRRRFRIGDLFKTFDLMQNLKVLVVGEAILDEYVYCETLGKSGKEPVLVARQIRQEMFAGGALAVANHLASFCDKVGLLTFLGSKKKGNNHESFIRKKLKPSVSPLFLYAKEAPTIIKRRFVENYPFQKMFETYIIDDELTTQDHEVLCRSLRKILPKYDVVIVIDYGHGMIEGEAISILCRNAPFLALNTQINAGNHGFCTISKYRRADFISVSEKELRLEARSRRGPLRALIPAVAKKLGSSRMLITRGGQGCVCYQKRSGFFDVPAFTTSVVDRVGAGDAVFAISSLCAARNMPMEAIGFVANTIGAQAVTIVGNKTSVERVSVLKHIESLLK